MNQTMAGDREMLHDVGAGWWPLTEALHEKLKAIDPDYKIVQVKEKFGGLRFYYETSQEDKDTWYKMYLLVSEYENESYRTCEECGSKENVTTATFERGWWIRTLCPSCRERGERKRKNPEA